MIAAYGPTPQSLGSLIEASLAVGDLDRARRAAAVAGTFGKRCGGPYLRAQVEQALAAKPVSPAGGAEGKGPMSRCPPGRLK